jgi:hypothetical protein
MLAAADFWGADAADWPKPLAALLRTGRTMRTRRRRASLKGGLVLMAFFSSSRRSTRASTAEISS